LHTFNLEEEKNEKITQCYFAYYYFGCAAVVFSKLSDFIGAPGKDRTCGTWIRDMILEVFGDV